MCLENATEIVSASKFQHQIHIDVERAMNSIDFFIDLQEDQLYSLNKLFSNI